MLRWAVIFLVVALFAALFGFGGIAGEAAAYAKILFFIFLVVAFVSPCCSGAGLPDVSHLDVDDRYRSQPVDETQKTELPVQVPDRTRPKPSKVGGVNSEMHITCQFRQGRAMVYDLKAGERRFEVRIQASATSQGQWGVAMLPKDGVERAPLDAVGPTRLLALEALEQGSGTLLGREDWVGIRRALTEVRAL